MVTTLWEKSPLHLRAYLAALPTNPPEYSQSLIQEWLGSVFWYAAQCDIMQRNDIVITQMV